MLKKNFNYNFHKATHLSIGVKESSINAINKFTGLTLFSLLKSFNKNKKFLYTKVYKDISNIRFFTLKTSEKKQTSLSQDLNSDLSSTNLNDLNTFVTDDKLTPFWVTGFSDAEASFLVNISKDSGYASGWRSKLVFQISLNMRDLQVLEKIKKFFNCGNITKDVKSNAYVYIVTDLEKLVKYIIPHFEAYPLISEKYGDFILFKNVALIFKRKEHLTPKGFMQILGYKYYLNKGLSDKLKLTFPGIIAIKRTINPSRVINDEWLVGFIDGDGHLGVTIYKNSIRLRFQITQHSRDIYLMKKIAIYLNCGRVYSRKQNIVDFTTMKFTDINDIIIPFINKVNLKTYKAYDFYLFSKVAKIIEIKRINKLANYSKEDIQKTLEIKENLNRYKTFS